MQRVLLTGATGFVGKNFIDYNNKYSDFVIDAVVRDKNINHISGVRDILYWDITNMFTMYDIEEFNTGEYDAILHCASLVGTHTGKTFHDYFNVNVLGTYHTLKIAEVLDIPHYVYVSTGSVYGEKGVYYPTSPCNPKGVYSATKRMGELVCQAFSANKKLGVSILRLFYPFGSYMDSNRFIPRILQSVKRNEEIVIDVSKPNVINPIHILDVCEYFNVVLKYVDVGIRNIAGFSNHSWISIAGIFGEELGIKPAIKCIGNKEDFDVFIGYPWYMNFKVESTEKRLREYVKSNY